MSAVHVHCVVSGVAVCCTVLVSGLHTVQLLACQLAILCAQARLPATIPCDMHETCSLQAFCGSHGQPNRSSKRGNLEEGDKSIHYAHQEK